MLELLKKDFIRVGIYVQIPIAIMVFFIITAPQDVLFGSFMRDLMVIVVGLGAVLIIEQNEEKHKGYNFLSTLPLSAKTIVRSKYLLVAIFIILMVLINATVVNIFFQQKENIHNAIVILVYCTGVALIYTGINFAGMMRWGATRFYTYSFVVLLGSSTAIVLGVQFVLPAGEVVKYLTSFTWEGGLIFIFLSLMFYLGTMLVSERILAKKIGQR